jgi:type IV secretory pathway ATPase VirB11/archaellum biosynthesis ATPase
MKVLKVRISTPSLLRWMDTTTSDTFEEVSSAGYAGTPAVTIADLVRATLRHRPDRILVREVRGPEAFDLLQTLNQLS